MAVPLSIRRRGRSRTCTIVGMKPGLPTLLTVHQVAEHLQLNIATVYRLVEKGEIPAVRIGGSLRFRADDLQALIEGERPTYADLPRLCTTYRDLGSFGTYAGVATTTRRT